MRIGNFEGFREPSEREVLIFSRYMEDCCRKRWNLMITTTLLASVATILLTVVLTLSEWRLLGVFIAIGIFFFLLLCAALIHYSLFMEKAIKAYKEGDFLVGTGTAYETTYDNFGNACFRVKNTAKEVTGTFYASEDKHVHDGDAVLLTVANQVVTKRPYTTAETLAYLANTYIKRRKAA